MYGLTVAYSSAVANGSPDTSAPTGMGFRLANGIDAVEVEGAFFTGLLRHDVFPFTVVT